MSAENKAVMRRWFHEVWNQGKTEVIPEMLASDSCTRGLVDNTGAPVLADQFKGFVEGMRTTFPDINFHVEDTVAEGDKVATLCTVRGTHRGPGFGLEPSGKKVEIQGLILTRFENGKIAESWNQFDFMGLLKQIGAM